MTAASVMGVDGGGSKTLLALADASGAVTKLVAGGGINPIDNPFWLDDFGALFNAFGCDPVVVARGVAAMPAYGEIDALTKAQDRGLPRQFLRRLRCAIEDEHIRTLVPNAEDGSPSSPTSS